MRPRHDDLAAVAQWARATRAGTNHGPAPRGGGGRLGASRRAGPSFRVRGFPQRGLLAAMSGRRSHVDQPPLLDLLPFVGPLAVVEAIHRMPSAPAAYAHAMIVHVIEGAGTILFHGKQYPVFAGDVLVVGAQKGCGTVPQPWMRSLTICVDESFLRTQMRWALPPGTPLAQGVDTGDWDGDPFLFHIDPDTTHALEPTLRRMSVATYSEDSGTTTRLMALFAKVVDAIVPTIVNSSSAPEAGRAPNRAHSPAPPMRHEVQVAVGLLRRQFDHQWLSSELAAAVALSESQLNRLFRRDTGLSPMRMLTEIRLTEFTRLVRETNLAIAVAARRVGWSDPEVAARWFRRRYGVTPSRYRAHARALGGPPASAGRIPVQGRRTR